MTPENELTTGTPEATTGTPPPAGGDGSEGNPEGGSESVEAKLAEAERKVAQLLGEKSNVEQRARDLEKLRDDLIRQNQPTPPTAGDPDMADLADLNEEVVRHGADSPEGRRAVREAKRIMELRKLRGAFAFRENLDRQLLDVEPEYREKVRVLVMDGKSESVASALTAVKSTSLEERVKALEAENATLKGGAPPKTPEAPKAPTPNVRTSVVSQLDASTAGKVPTLADYQRIMAAGGPAAQKLQRDIDEGRIPDPNFAA